MPKSRPIYFFKLYSRYIKKFFENTQFRGQLDDILYKIHIDFSTSISKSTLWNFSFVPSKSLPAKIFESIFFRLVFPSFCHILSLSFLSKFNLFKILYLGALDDFRLKIIILLKYKFAHYLCRLLSIHLDIFLHIIFIEIIAWIVS